MRVVDTPITELGFAGVGVGAAMVGPAAGHRVHDLELRAARDRPGREHRGQDALHVRRPGQRPDRVPRPGRRRAAARRAALAGVRELATPTSPASRWSRRPRRPTPRGCSRARSATTTRWSSSRARCSTTPRARSPTASTSSRSARPTSSARASDVTIVSHWQDGRRRAQGRRAARRAKASTPRSSISAPSARWTSRRCSTSVSKTNRCVVVEEGWALCGVGAQVVDNIQREASTSSTRRSCASPGRRAHAVRQEPREAPPSPTRPRTIAAVEESHVPRLRRMATKVVMEALSPTMEEGRLVKWMKNEGEPVAVGDVLAEVETDKAIMELVARGDGMLRKRVVAAGATVPVSQLGGGHRRAGRSGGRAAATAPSRAGAGDPGDASRRRTRSRPAADAAPLRRHPRRHRAAGIQPHACAGPPQPPATPPPAGRPGQGLAARAPARGRARARPRRRQGSGPRAGSSSATSSEARRGSRAAAAAARRPATASYRACRAGRRFRRRPAHPDPQDDRQAARRVHRADPDLLSHRRSRHRARRGRRARRSTRMGDEFKVSFNDIMLKAVATRAPAASGVQRALAGRPDPLLQRRAPRHGGRDRGRADHAGDPRRRPQALREIAAEARELAKRARERKLKPEEYTGSTFSVSNLGMFDIDQFTADHQSARGRDPRHRADRARSRWSHDGAGRGPQAHARSR